MVEENSDAEVVAAALEEHARGLHDIADAIREFSAAVAPASEPQRGPAHGLNLLANHIAGLDSDNSLAGAVDDLVQAVYSLKQK